MKSVVLSRKAQIVLPKEIREAVGLQLGAQVMLVPEGNIIHIVPLHDIDSYRGLLAGSDPTDYRDRVDRPVQ